MGGRFRVYAPPVVNEPEGKRDGRRFQPVVGRVAAATDQASEACIAEANTRAVCRWRRLGPAAPLSSPRQRKFSLCGSRTCAKIPIIWFVTASR